MTPPAPALGPIHPRFFSIFVLSALFWASIFLGLIFVIDPYGVSPLQLSWKQINQFKVNRIDIDRIIKPYEVWWYQPRTVFLGTSRIHQSIDPTDLEGTRFAPAYNAAIPASSLMLNAANLKNYLDFDSNLRFVFVELFPYQFTQFTTPEPAWQQLPGYAQIATNAAKLFFSGSALSDSLQTIAFNQKSHDAAGFPAYIHPKGFWVRPEYRGVDVVGWSSNYIQAIMNGHTKEPSVMAIQSTSFPQLDRMIEMCKKRGVEIYFFITPNWPGDDYRLLSLGYWPLLEAWYRQLADYPNVISFARYNDAVEEPITVNLYYWYDTIHFNRHMGRLMLKTFLGEYEPIHGESDPFHINQGPGARNDVMLRINNENVDFALEDRRKGLDRWISRNRGFVEAFDRAKFATGNDPSQRRSK